MREKEEDIDSRSIFVFPFFKTAKMKEWKEAPIYSEEEKKFNYTYTGRYIVVFSTWLVKFHEGEWYTRRFNKDYTTEKEPTCFQTVNIIQDFLSVANFACETFQKYEGEELNTYDWVKIRNPESSGMCDKKFSITEKFLNFYKYTEKE